MNAAPKLPNERRAEANAKFSNYFQRVEFADNPNMGYYAKLLEFLKGRGAQICVLVFPASESFLAVARGQPEYVQMMNTYRRLAERHGGRFVNLHGSFVDDRHYLDGTHIRPAPAREVAREAARRCFDAAEGPES